MWRLRQQAWRPQVDLQDELLIPPAASRPKWHFLAPLGVAVLCLCFPQDRGLLSSTAEPGSLPPGCQSAAKELCGEPPRCFSRSCKGLLANHAINSSAANADSSAVRMGLGFIGYGHDVQANSRISVLVHVETMCQPFDACNFFSWLCASSFDSETSVSRSYEVKRVQEPRSTAASIVCLCQDGLLHRRRGTPAPRSQ